MVHAEQPHHPIADHGGGRYFQPTVLSGVTPDMAIFQEETFGPVLALVRVKDEEDAVLKTQHSFGKPDPILAGLPENQSKVIGLAFYGGFSQTEISDLLELPLGTVKGRMRLGMEKLRSELGTLEGERT